MLLFTACSQTKPIEIQGIDLSNKIDTFHSSDIYPELFKLLDYNNNKDSCIESFGLIQISKEKVIRYIAPAIGSVCIEKATKNYLMVTIKTGVDSGNNQHAVDIHFFNYYKYSDSVYIEYINKVDDTLIGDCYMDQLYAASTEDEIFLISLCLIEKYAYKSFNDRSYIDSLHIIGDTCQYLDP
ncbi:MAG: hypothetical protein JJT94_09795, partial [Bernardetiaceae bacterium]|nr:hypothetical protein [Bernardetiaceae bacterium]